MLGEDKPTREELRKIKATDDDIQEIQNGLRDNIIIGIVTSEKISSVIGKM